MKIKICGLKTIDDSMAAIEAGADMLGFNFYPPSVRYIERQECRAIVDVIKNSHPGIRCVGIFVNSVVSMVGATMDACRLDLAQLSGDEPPDDLRTLGDRAFKAIRLRNTNQAHGEIETFPMRTVPPAFLLDSHVKGAYGGSGSPADWDLAAEIAISYPILLAGGLTSENVTAAIEHVRPWGVDVASGVERKPGIKDHKLIETFISAARLAAGSLMQPEE